MVFITPPCGEITWIFLVFLRGLSLLRDIYRCFSGGVVGPATLGTRVVGSGAAHAHETRVRAILKRSCDGRNNEQGQRGLAHRQVCPRNRARAPEGGGREATMY